MKTKQTPRYSHVLATVTLITLASTVSSWAVYIPSQLPDPSRRWSVSLGSRAGYEYTKIGGNSDDSLTTIIEPKLYLNLPMDQSFLGFRYTYQAIYYESRDSDNWDQNHIADLLFSHRFTPRLTLDINDSFRRAVEPELVELVNGVDELRRREGDFWYNSLNAKLTYSLTSRWLVSLGQGWEHWSYDETAVADTSDRDTYSTSGAALYTIDPVSSVGLNIRYSAVRYDKSGVDDARDSDSYTGFLSYTRLLSPKLNWNIGGGATYSRFGNGDSDTSPYGTLALAYTYAPDSSLSVGATYSFFTADQTTYRSSDALASYLQVSHRVSRKCRLTLNTSYIHRNYQNLNDAIVLPGVPDNADEDSVRFSASVSYSFTRWLFLDVNYSHERTWTDVGNDYYRNRVSGGVRVTF